MKAKKILLPLIAAVVIIAVMVAAYFTIGENGAFATPWALLAPVIAIALALITKEVYSSLFIGVVIGAVLNANFSFTGTIDAAIEGGLIAAVADSSGIFIFLVFLGIIVALINKSGGSQAFGRWAQTHIKTKAGAMLATFILGVFIFIDDYFNCLTVGSVMAPVTDSHKISRAKLAFLIDATAAPICMIAPISSWAAAVSGCVESETYSGIELFVRAIPYNFYSLLTLGFIILIAIIGFDYGKMSFSELKAQDGEFGIIKTATDDTPSEASHKGKVIDLLLPIVVLIVACVAGLIYVGYKSEGVNNIVDAFGSTDAYVGLPWGCIIALVIIVVYLMARHIITFKEAMECVPKGFIAMVPAILILTLATALKNMTGGLGADAYVEGLMKSAAPGLASFLPAIIFVVACFLAFATGTSWGTFGILIPIVTSMFAETDPLFFIGVSACLAGAVCGDHCSPISDTTIMASAGAQCNHIEHVSTQLPYAITVAAVSFVSFIIAGFVKNVYIALPAAFALLIVTVLVIKAITAKKSKA
ncbi:MAG: Na+/H+ antiporter NhaC family protein [Ruminococcaceae bacterium]|nr:Na+/H+ antiporter NhaC family protein [Oscillospiraceae bacterium]